MEQERLIKTSTYPRSPWCIYHEHDEVCGFNDTPNGVDDDEHKSTCLQEGIVER
jgi:hypothetical protein